MQDFTVFRALGLSFKSLFRNFIPIVLLAAVLYAPVVAYIYSIDLNSLEGVDVVNKAFYYPYALMSIATGLLPCFIIYRIVQDLNGTKVSMLTSVKLGLRGILPAIVIGIISMVLGFVPFGSIVNLVLTCIWFVAGPAAVAERITNPFSAMSRSSVLTSGRRWGIFGMLVLMIISLVAIVFLFIVPAIENKSVEDFFSEYHRLALASIAFVSAIQIFFGVVQAVSYALLRQDKEGVGNDDLAKIFE